MPPTESVVIALAVAIALAITVAAAQIGGAFYPNGMIVLLRSSAFASPMQFDALPEAAAWIRSIGWEAQS